MGFDLNRHWQEPSPWAHPTLYATKNLLMEYDRDEVSVICGKSFHAHAVMQQSKVSIYIYS
jgi:hypothetical protein